MARQLRQKARLYDLVEDMLALLDEEIATKQAALAEAQARHRRTLEWATASGYPYAELEEAVG